MLEQQVNFETTDSKERYLALPFCQLPNAFNTEGLVRRSALRMLKDD
jgi:hypothetical protein